MSEKFDWPLDESLRKAAMAGKVQAIREMLAIGASALAVDHNGMTALMWSVTQGHEECAKVLLPVSDALALDNRGETALMKASYLGREGCASALIPLSDLHAVDRYGRTALTGAIQYGQLGIRDLLIAWDEAKELGREVAPGVRGKRKLGL